MTVDGVVRRLLPVVPFLVADAVAAWGITMVVGQHCFRCTVPRNSMNDVEAVFPDRVATDMYELLDRAKEGDEAARDDLRDLSQHWYLPEVSPIPLPTHVNRGGRHVSGLLG